MMKFNDIAKNVAHGVMVRLGTAAAIWLVAHGVPEDLVDQLITAIGIAGGLLFDIAVVLLLRRARTW